jgi:hypothetical protein
MSKRYVLITELLRNRATTKRHVLLKLTRLNLFFMRMHKNFYLAGAILFLIDLLIPCSTLKRRKIFFEVIWVYRLFRLAIASYL